MGAWIEIYLSSWPAPSVCVAPFMGAWIEITGYQDKDKIVMVAPFMGAWIEIGCIYLLSVLTARRTLHGCVDWNTDDLAWDVQRQLGRTLHGCVDWNILATIPYYFNCVSHPSWVRGLKLIQSSWHSAPVFGRTLHGCVDWNFYFNYINFTIIPSHPSWVRGLK